MFLPSLDSHLVYLSRRSIFLVVLIIGILLLSGVSKPFQRWFANFKVTLMSEVTVNVKIYSMSKVTVYVKISSISQKWRLIRTIVVFFPKDTAFGKKWKETTKITATSASSSQKWQLISKLTTDVKSDNWCQKWQLMHFMINIDYFLTREKESNFS